MGATQTILETDRLLLRELALSDLDFVAEMVAHPVVMFFWPKTYTREEAEGWIHRQHERYAQDGYGYWLVIEKATGQPVGQAGLLRQEFEGTTETGIGYIMHRPFWRRGFATEAALGCRDLAFAKLKKEKLVVLVRPENVVSAAVARKIGGQSDREINYAGFAHTVFVCRASAPKAASAE